MKPAIPFIAAADYAHTGAWIAALQQAMPEERICDLAALDEAERAQCEVAIVANPDPAELRRLPNLQWVHSVWAGVERLLHEHASAPWQIVRLVDPQLADTMAEAVLAWTLYLHRNMPAYAAFQRERRWRPLPYLRPQQRVVSLLGLGELGCAAAARLQAAGFQVCGWSRAQRSLDGVQCFSGAAGLAAMLAQTDTLVCLLPLTPATRGLLDAHTLGLLKRGASLINFARGAIVEDQALRYALSSGQLAHAVLDVFSVEPLPQDAWQWGHPAVTVLPHCSAPTDRATASDIVARNLRAFRVHGVVPQPVDPQRGY